MATRASSGEISSSWAGHLAQDAHLRRLRDRPHDRGHALGGQERPQQEHGVHAGERGPQGVGRG
ncbi:hypothetical protein [Micromonospora sp. CPCC 206061]|uniref:hypothetical protein n=1 Tax=Micromonospora sp. CPCC 206061 TaxID=3122410 RepID=UPI003FA5798C